MNRSSDGTPNPIGQWKRSPNISTLGVRQPEASAAPMPTGRRPPRLDTRPLRYPGNSSGIGPSGLSSRELRRGGPHTLLRRQGKPGGHASLPAETVVTRNPMFIVRRNTRTRSGTGGNVIDRSLKIGVRPVVVFLATRIPDAQNHSVVDDRRRFRRRRGRVGRTAARRGIPIP